VAWVQLLFVSTSEAHEQAKGVMAHVEATELLQM
jgi:hypothetical protein